ncbi:phage minor head protein [Pseudoxanthomonas sacheonensis]|uniref:phage minor head protein n=1 Tax=Pseudoxanthomonas sacheonensis TaxID=443615 RepID=UPI0013D0ED5A|nr:phage minor head protein [Pseudoxanthomonas sacheonensis]KAF1706279.1 hypothetical protein CSC73_16375 [Pseudoxanthomonas sacheonensis]
MAAVNARLQDEAVDHAVNLHRYSNGIVRRMVAVLNRTDARLSAQLAEQLMRLDASTFTVERLESLLRSVRELNERAYSQVLEALEPEIQGLAEYEAGYQYRALREAVPAAVQIRFAVSAVGADQVYAAALSRPFQGRLLSGWFQNLPESRMRLIQNTVRAGYMEGRTAAEIVRQIRGTKALNYADGILDRSRRELMTVVNTALSHTAQTARATFADANRDLVKATKWVSTLDARTSEECRIRDGLLYEVDTHKPIGHRIPWLQGPGRLHFNCRSVSTLVTKSWRELGIDVDDMPAATRASMDGQVPADTTYSEWLGRQSAERQDEVLGAARGKLFRQGIPMDKFYNDKGQWLTLDQLYQREGLTRP